MAQILQSLVFVGSIIGLIAFGFYRDMKEHNPGRGSVSAGEPRSSEATRQPTPAALQRTR